MIYKYVILKINKDDQNGKSGKLEYHVLLQLNESYKIGMKYDKDKNGKMYHCCGWRFLDFVMTHNRLKARLNFYHENNPYLFLDYLNRFPEIFNNACNSNFYFGELCGIMPTLGICEKDIYQTGEIDVNGRTEFINKDHTIKRVFEIIREENKI